MRELFTFPVGFKSPQAFVNDDFESVFELLPYQILTREDLLHGPLPMCRSWRRGDHIVSPLNSFSCVGVKRGLFNLLLRISFIA